MKTNPLVTICVPTYNCSELIEKTLISITKQSYKNIKIKVFDNCSTDNTLKVLQKMKNFGQNFEITTSDVNLGGEGNFNRCIQAAEGDYTALFHADDMYSPSIVKTAIEAMENNPEIVAVAFHANIIDESGFKIGERFVPQELKNKDSTLLDQKLLVKLILKYGNFITCPSVIARSKIYLNDIKNWNGSEYKSSADLDVWLRMSEKGKILFINKPLMSYRESTASFSYNLFKKRVHRHDLFLVLDKVILDKNLSLKDYRNYNFLQFKDSALRSLNIIRNLSSEPFPRSHFLIKDVVITGFQSQFHLKYLFIGIMVTFLKLLFPRFLRNYLSKLKRP